MEIQWTKMSVQELTKILSEAEKDLEKSLISGLDWKEVKEKVNMITEINIAIHRKKYPLTGSPAESPFRD